MPRRRRGCPGRRGGCRKRRKGGVGLGVRVPRPARALSARSRPEGLHCRRSLLPDLGDVLIGSQRSEALTVADRHPLCGRHCRRLSGCALSTNGGRINPTQPPCPGRASPSGRDRAESGLSARGTPTRLGSRNKREWQRSGIAPGGFEPPFSDPKSDVLPLDEGAAVLQALT